MNHKGFTLIESLVILVIVGMLSAIAFPAWLGFINIQRLNGARNLAFSSLRLAQSMAKKDQVTYQISFREYNNLLQVAIHPATVAPENWQNFAEGVRIDPETTLLQTIGSGYKRVRFNAKGLPSGQLGRLTLSSANSGKAKRCVIVSTLLGAMRTSSEQPTPNASGKYCY